MKPPGLQRVLTDTKKNCSYLASLLLITGHDDDLYLALDDHPPEVIDSVGQRTLTGDVRRRPARPSDIVGIDVVAAGHPCILVQHHSTCVNCQQGLAIIYLLLELYNNTVS